MSIAKENGVGYSDYGERDEKQAVFSFQNQRLYTNVAPSVLFHQKSLRRWGICVKGCMDRQTKILIITEEMEKLNEKSLEIWGLMNMDLPKAKREVDRRFQDLKNKLDELILNEE